MKIEYTPKDPKTFNTVSGVLWKYANVMVSGLNGRHTVSWSLYIALCDDHPWWCPRWLMEKIKKHILKIYVKDLKIFATRSERD